jgi:hypothetical protein
MNFHTGESLVGLGGTNSGIAGGVPVLGVNVAANYSAFVHQDDGRGVVMRPQAYAFLAFSQGAHGRPLDVKLQAPASLNFSAYAYRDLDGSIFVTLINKSYGDHAQPASVSIQFGQNADVGSWEEMDLMQQDQDVAAKTGVTLGGAAVDSQGIWQGEWKQIERSVSIPVTVQVPPASAIILHLPLVVR